MISSSSMSLLYPPNSAPVSRPFGAPDEHDLGLAPIAQLLDYDHRHRRAISQILAELHADPYVIHYRQAVLNDFLAAPAFAGQIEAVLPQLRDLGEVRPFQQVTDRTPLLHIAGRMGELENYVSCVEGLATALAQANAVLRSDGLQALHAYVTDIQAEPDYERLKANLPELRAQLDQAGSVTLGINLDPQLRPESATIVSINHGRFAGKGTLLERLLGDRASEAIRGITSLYKANEGPGSRPEHDLFRDLNRLLERVAAPVAAELERYARVNTTRLTALEPELAWYLGASKLAVQMQATGLPLCWPDIAPMDERICQIEGNYSLDLAIRLERSRGHSITEVIVANDVAFSRSTPIGLLTGPNSGGKTTYLRAIGQAQVLFQAGLLVPGRRARISPVDAIYTHFATAERLDRDGGRLSEELERLGRVFATATGDSLVLLNEPLTSTDHSAARLLARDLLAGLRLLGTRAMFVTHLHELYEDMQADDNNNRLPKIISLVAGARSQNGNGTQQVLPTYKIEPRSPQSLNYASELAQRYGLSRTQIEQTLRERGLIPDLLNTHL